MSKQAEIQTVEQVEAKIAAHHAEKQRLADKLEEIEQRLILTGDQDASSLDEIARLQTRLRLANGHEAVLQRELSYAQGEVALAAYEAEAKKLHALSVELQGVEKGEEWETVQRRHKEIREQIRTLLKRVDFQSSTVDAALVTLNRTLPEDPEVKAELQRRAAEIRAALPDHSFRLWTQTEQIYEW